ncbi:MAG: hypothetical protein V7711_15075 [Pseudomonadales bacterium]
MKADTAINRRDIDWRIILGLTLTGAYMFLMITYVSDRVGWSHFAEASLDLMGSFLEGAFAPLAFLWLVIGYFLQQKELKQNTEALHMQSLESRKVAEQAVIQSRAIAASESHQRKESFLTVAESVKAQLGGILGFLYLSSQGSAASGNVSSERMVELWNSLGKEDTEVFARELLVLRVSSPESYVYKLYFGTPTRSRHTKNFSFVFERLLSEAHGCDSSGMIPDALLGSAHGFIYQAIKELSDNIPEGYTLGVYDFDPDSIDD